MPILSIKNRPRARYSKFADALLKLNVINAERLEVVSEEARQAKQPLERYLV